MKDVRDKKQGEPGGGDVYRYQHAGIQERDGSIPLWLKLVVLGLLIWSVYYAIRYWNPA